MARKKQINETIGLVETTAEGWAFSVGDKKTISERTSNASRVNPDYGRGLEKNGNYDYITANSPFNTSRCGVDVAELIKLSKLAFYNSQSYRNALLNLIFLSNTKIILKGSDEKIINFYKAWLEKINIWQFCNEYFTEWYRSGNLFIWRAASDYKLSDVRKMTQAERETVAKNKKVPIKYVMLDPEMIRAGGAANLINQTYCKVLSQFEVARLKNPQTPQEKEFYNSLDAESKRNIQSGIAPMINLDSENLIAIFNNRQPYEPLAVPTFTPILKLVNLREFMHSADQALLESIDLAVLFCTIGTEDGDLKGYNRSLIAGLTQMLSARGASRAIVAHYSAKAAFILPDLSKVMSPARFDSINSEINAGLMDLFAMSDTFSSSYVKSKIYLELLKQGQDSFLTQFLVPEMKAIADELGFTSVPEVEFEEISLESEAEKMKMFIRMYEMGALTAEGLQQAMKDKTLPLPDINDLQQKEFKRLKDQGLYEPIVGKATADEGRPVGAKKTQTKKAPKSPAKAEVEEENVASLNQIKENMSKMDEVFKTVEAAYKDKHGLQRLYKKHKTLSDTVATNIIANEPMDKWKESVAEYLEHPCSVVINSQREAIMDIMQEHDVPTISAAILYHGGKK